VLDRGDERLGLHYHALAAAVGDVVDDGVLVGRVVAEVVHGDVEEPILARDADGARGERAAEELGEDGEEVDLHGACSRLGFGDGRSTVARSSRTPRLSHRGADHTRPARGPCTSLRRGTERLHDARAELRGDLDRTEAVQMRVEPGEPHGVSEAIDGHRFVEVDQLRPLPRRRSDNA
jgi:hypothetical protein